MTIHLCTLSTIVDDYECSEITIGTDIYGSILVKSDSTKIYGEMDFTLNKETARIFAETILKHLECDE